LTYERPKPQEPTMSVVVAGFDIPPGTKLYPLVAEGVLQVVAVPESLVTPAAIESTDDLRGSRTPTGS
jgi:hypothetical protein